MERWFVLKPNIISYYVSEDLKDKKGDIILDGNCCVEVKPFKKLCMSLKIRINPFLCGIESWYLLKELFLLHMTPVHEHPFNEGS